MERYARSPRQLPASPGTRKNVLEEKVDNWFTQ